jgi:peptidoglycan/xylan/chitin deacetylase (PgdA/CDA1 family)
MLAAVLVAAGAGFIGGQLAERHPGPTDRVPPLPGAIDGGLAVEVVWKVDTDQQLFALTFDDGPDPHWTPEFLDVLAAHGTRATFFQLGEAASEHPELVARVVAEGHEVASHGWDHSRLTTMPAAAVSPALFRASQTLEDLSGQSVVLFRPTYGRLDQLGLRAAAELNHTVVLWSHVLHGGEEAPGDVERVLKTARPGMVILCHDGRSSPDQALVEAVDSLLGRLEAAGFHGVTVSELMAAQMAG